MSGSIQNWLTLILTPGLLIISDRTVLARSVSELGSAKNTIIQKNNRLKTKLLPQILSQTIPNPIPPRTPEPPIEDPQPQPQPPVELEPAPDPIPPGLSEIPGTITVFEFKFVGNTAFTEDELKEALKEFTGKPISFAELL